MATKHEAMERDFCAAFDGIACLVVDHAQFQCRGRALALRLAGRASLPLAHGCADLPNLFRRFGACVLQG